MRRILISVTVILLILLAIFFSIVPAQVEKRMNPIIAAPPYHASERAGALHKKLTIVDLHADSLLWGRDLLERGSRGHVDLPRLIEGNVAIQAFTVVTKTPRNMSIEKNDASTDNITLLAVANLWPVRAWTSLKERALFQAGRLQDMAERSNGTLTLIATVDDLQDYLERRKSDHSLVAGFLGLEGAHALEGNIGNVEVLFAAGFRMIGLTHFFDNEFAGSAHGMEKGGLTDKGRELVGRLEANRMLIDLAHSSTRTIEDVLAIATRPVVVSHTGVKGTCDNQRNLSDEQLKAIAKTRGVIGIGFWETATCGKDAGAIARAIKHAVNVAGIEHVGLGSDYDGAIEAPFDASGLVLITEALQAEGFSDSQIELIMGGNVIRLLKETLPTE